MNARILAFEVRDELRGIVREPAAVFFSILMPVGFFALFASMYGAQPAGGVATGTAMLALFGAFGVVGVTLLTPGIGVAEDRERGWLRVKRVSPVPVGATLLAKVLAARPVALGVFIPMVIASGLWMPLDTLPAFVGRSAPLLPTYHVSQLGLGLLLGDPVGDHVLALG